MRLYVEIARRALRRQLTYRTANLAGLVTNTFFGYVRGAVILAIFATQDSVAGYDAQAALTYVWFTQASIMIVALWGWWEVEQTIRTGDVVSDLARPWSYLWYWLARDLGRAVYFLVFRFAPLLLAGHLLMGLRWPASPSTWVAAGVSLTLAVVISFAWRFLLNLTAFWTIDARGLGMVALAVSMFLGGFLIPVRFFPEWAQPLVQALPFVAISQTPADVFVERAQGLEIVALLGHQAIWAVVLLGCAHLVVAAATQRVITQGG